MPSEKNDAEDALTGVKAFVVRGGELFAPAADRDFPFDHHEVAVSIGTEERSMRTVKYKGISYRSAVDRRPADQSPRPEE